MPAGQGFAQRVEAFEKQLLLTALRASNFRLNEAADSLGLTYDQFRYLFRKYDLRQLDPGFDSRTFGFRQLSGLIRSYADLFETRYQELEGRTDVFVRMKEDKAEA